jgi:prolyl-tRNA synthetase
VRFSHLHCPTLKEDPTDADVVSHRLLVRAGMMRQVARGIYDFLPLGLRSVRKVERIVRQELDAAGCQEVLLPVICPAELWQESGRWDRYGKELLRLRDRHDREFCVGPTHEEVITDLVRRDVRSYRDLPLNLYQIQTKFRDEVRPRFGLMRGREFVMKDGYSFHASYEDCVREYEHMRATYGRIFRRCGLTFRIVEADTGAIGGSMSHEFQVLASSGEDLIVSCSACEYAANVEKAETGDVEATAFEPGDLTRVSTPGARTIEEVAAFLGEPPIRFIKTLIVVADGVPAMALVRGDDQLSEPKLKSLLGADELRMAEDTEIERVTGGPQGFSGPIGASVRVVADKRLAGCVGMVTGANVPDAHVKNVEQARDFPAADFADLRLARAGDPCGRCGKGAFAEHRGIEVGQVFYLGTKYSEPLKATYLDAAGDERVTEMGTYGIGITRTVAAAIEQNHDDRGIVWPMAIAPYEVILVPVKWDDDRSREVAESLYDSLWAAGVETVLDDRDERAGVKFNDADLIGIPLRVTIGPRGIKAGTIELKRRGDDAGEGAEELPIEGAAEKIAARVREARAA